MIPSLWVGLALVFAAYRLVRLAGWDEFPLALKIRAWIIGETWVTVHAVPEGAEKAADTGRVDPAELGLPGKQPTSEVAEVRPAYARPTLAHLFHCPFCIGFWISTAVYYGWVAAGAPGRIAATSPLFYVLVPFAISGAVGIIAKNLDA